MKKIALPVTNNNQIDDHFGHCEFYGIYTVSDNNEIIDTQILKSEQGCGCKSNIAGILAEKGVKVMLAGGIGAGAINVLNRFGIDVVRGCSGNASDVLNKYLQGKISDSGESCVQHEQHQENGHGKNGHNCSHS